jgi:hypothetical protein
LLSGSRRKFRVGFLGIQRIWVNNISGGIFDSSSDRAGTRRQQRRRQSTELKPSLREKRAGRGCRRRFRFPLAVLALSTRQAKKNPHQTRSASCATFHMLLFFPECLPLRTKPSVRSSRGRTSGIFLSPRAFCAARNFSKSLWPPAKAISSVVIVFSQIIELYSFLASLCRQHPWHFTFFPSQQFFPLQFTFFLLASRRIFVNINGTGGCQWIKAVYSDVARVNELGSRMRGDFLSRVLTVSVQSSPAPRL